MSSDAPNTPSSPSCRTRAPTPSCKPADACFCRSLTASKQSLTTTEKSSPLTPKSQPRWGRYAILPSLTTRGNVASTNTRTASSDSTSKKVQTSLCCLMPMSKGSRINSTHAPERYSAIRHLARFSPTPRLCVLHFTVEWAQGVIPDLRKPESESDFYFVEADDPETAVARIIELVRTRIPRRFGLDSIRDVQVLCPMNRGGVGARSLNIELQAALNPAADRKVERFGWTFAPGDKVMQIENDYDKEVYNGDIGYIDDVDPNAGEIVASFDGRSVTYGFGELDMLVPAYAATIHKSQGSEYPAVVIPVMTQHYAMLQRNLLYTGVTRGKRLVVLVGQKKAVAIAVRSVAGRRRWSKLREWLESAAATR